MSQTPLIVVEVVLVGVLAAIVVGQHGSGHHAKAASTAPTAPSLPTADSAPAVSTTAAAPTTTTTAPRPTTTTIDPVRDANADYLTMATAAYQVHVIAHARYAARNGRIAWINFPAYCGAIDGADITFAHRLGEHWWPPSARPSVARLVLDTAGLADLEQQCAHTSGRSRAIQTIANQIGVATTKTAADQSGVQTALGLPVTS
jgi:hypothetical protein